jgi:hypothetical protein
VAHWLPALDSEEPEELQVAEEELAGEDDGNEETESEDKPPAVIPRTCPRR